MPETILLIEDHPAYVAGNWYLPTRASVAAGAVITANQIRLLPFYVPHPITISDLGCCVTTAAASGNVQLGIYDNDPDTNLPSGVPLGNTGNISTAATGAVSATLAGGDLTLERGWYWYAAHVDTNGASAVFSAPNTTAVTMSFWMGDATLSNIMPAGGATGILRYSYPNPNAFGTWPDLTGETMTRAMSPACVNVAYKVASVP